MAEITVAGGTRIGFSANKSLSEAQALKDNRLVICKGHELSFNGQRVGLSESEASFIKEKMDEEFKARIGVKLVVSPTVQDAAAPERVSVSVILHIRWRGCCARCSSYGPSISWWTVAWYTHYHDCRWR